MTCHVEHIPEGGVKSMRFTCDHPEGCGVSPSSEEIIAAGGMVAMGWDCAGGKHYCPQHRRDREGDNDNQCRE